MSVYNYRPMPPPNPNRLLELLEAIKLEYDHLTQDAIITKTQRDEYEHKVNSQIQEMNLFQQTMADLERTQHLVKKQYEEEINRLKHQLDQLQRNTGYVPDDKPITKPTPPVLPTKTSILNGPNPGMLPLQQVSHHINTPDRPLIASKYNGQPIANVGLNDLDPESIPSSMKIEGHDWFAIFNPKTPRYLNVNLLSTMEHDSVVCCVRFSADGRYLAAGCNQTTYIYDTMTYNRVASLQDDTANKGEDLYIRSVSFSPDGKYLATGAEDRLIRIWDIVNKRIRCRLSGHEQDIYSLEFSRDGRILVSGSGDKSTRIWDWSEAKCLHKLLVNETEQSDPGVTSISISPDGRLIATGSLNKIIRIWDAMTGTLLEKLEGHKDSVYSLSFLPDGKTLVSGSLDKTLRLWQLGKGHYANPCLQIFSGHKDFVLSVATSPDNRWILSGSKDRSVQFWDTKTGQIQFMLQGHKNSVISVAVNPSKRPLFATGSGDNRVRIWSYEPLTM
ncbi:WD40-repeat-containing domain protein [Pilobolus umbonatus]|nr:WD40-repeat-containing domain protein [Pilobolus umbonatus]